jgi:hypothetical protein
MNSPLCLGIMSSRAEIHVELELACTTLGFFAANIVAMVGPRPPMAVPGVPWQ